MNQRLSHLKELLAEKGATHHTDKTDGRSFVSSVRDQGRHLSRDEVIVRAPDRRTTDAVLHEPQERLLVEKGLPPSPTKLTEGVCVSSVSCQGGDNSEEGGNQEDGIVAFEERAAICEYDGGLERGQAESLAALQAMPLPTGVNENERKIVIDAAARFLDQQRRRR